MRIGLNMLFIVPGTSGGIETYAKELLRALDELGTRDDLIAFVPAAALAAMPQLSPRVKWVTSEWNLANRLYKNSYEQVVLPGVVKREHLDVLHSLAYVAPVASSVPQVVTIHDMNSFFAHHQVRGLKRYLLRRLCHAAAARAKKVVTVSEFTRREVAAKWPRFAGKCVTVPEAGDHVPKRGPARNGERQGFLLLVSGGRHKNCEMAIRAFGCAGGRDQWPLILVGRVLPELRREIMGLEPARRSLVREMGFVSRPELESIFLSAGALVYPSMYEGFGLPILEAQRSGLPVVCSTSASLPEVAGAGACYFSADDLSGLTGCMESVENSTEVRAGLAERGYVNSGRFSWHKTAEAMLGIYRQVGGAC